MIVRVLTGFVFGAMVGILLGIAVAVVFAQGITLLHPDDPSAGNAGIVIFLTVPGGMVIGAFIGAYRELAKDASTKDDLGRR